MIYYLLRALFRISNKFYFKTLHIEGIENIPAKGPVFFVANHPSAFMDPIVIGTVVNRPLFFLAKGGAFQNSFARWLLPKFNMIPIYRMHETPGQTHKNKEVFATCHNHLAKGGAILAFPEGISITERKIKKIQSGAARICLGAEEKNNFSLGIKIISIGLNFSNPHKFQSDLLVNIDKPIEVLDFVEAYKADSFKGVHALTDEIRKRIEAQVVAVQDAEVDKLISNIEQIFKSQLLYIRGYSQSDMKHDFEMSKAIVDSVHYFIEHEPERVNKIQAEITSYLRELQKLRLSDKTLNERKQASPISDGLKILLYFGLGLPPFIYGYLNNILPFRIPYWSSKLISKRPEFYGSIALSLGTLSFILFYLLQIYLVHHVFSDWRISTLYGISLPISGYFAFTYYEKFLGLKNKMQLFNLFYRKTNLISALIARRQKIISELEKGREDFLNRKNIDT